MHKKLGEGRGGGGLTELSNTLNRKANNEQKNTKSSPNLTCSYIIILHKEDSRLMVHRFT